MYLTNIIKLWCINILFIYITSISAFTAKDRHDLSVYRQQEMQKKDYPFFLSCLQTLIAAIVSRVILHLALDQEALQRNQTCCFILCQSLSFLVPIGANYIAYKYANKPLALIRRVSGMLLGHCIAFGIIYVYRHLAPYPEAPSRNSIEEIERLLKVVDVLGKLSYTNNTAS